jgi:hypothetical protein
MTNDPDDKSEPTPAVCWVLLVLGTVVFFATLPWLSHAASLDHRELKLSGHFVYYAGGWLIMGLSGLCLGLCFLISGRSNTAFDKLQLQIREFPTHSNVVAVAVDGAAVDGRQAGSLLVLRGIKEWPPELAAALVQAAGDRDRAVSVARSRSLAHRSMRAIKQHKVLMGRTPAILVEYRFEGMAPAVDVRARLTLIRLTPILRAIVAEVLDVAEAGVNRVPDPETA